MTWYSSMLCLCRRGGGAGAEGHRHHPGLPMVSRRSTEMSVPTVPPLPPGLSCFDSLHSRDGRCALFVEVAIDRGGGCVGMTYKTTLSQVFRAPFFTLLICQ